MRFLLGILEALKLVIPGYRHSIMRPRVLGSQAVLQQKSWRQETVLPSHAPPKKKWDADTSLGCQGLLDISRRAKLQSDEPLTTTSQHETSSL